MNYLQFQTKLTKMLTSMEVPVHFSKSSAIKLLLYNFDFDGGFFFCENHIKNMELSLKFIDTQIDFDLFSQHCAIIYAMDNFSTLCMKWC